MSQSDTEKQTKTESTAEDATQTNDDSWQSAEQTAKDFRSRWLPTFVSDLGDPFVQLKYNVDVKKTFAQTEIARKARPDEESGDDADQPKDSKKKSTLKRMMKKSHSTKDTDTVTAPSFKVKVKLTQDQELRLKAEIDRIVGSLSKAVDVFVDLVCFLTKITNKAVVTELFQFAPYVLIDTSVSYHPDLKDLRLGDNSVYVQLGKDLLSQFAMSTAAAQGKSLAHAKQRLKRCTDLLHVWLTERTRRFKQNIQEAMPVVWSLDSKNHEPLPETFLLKTANDRMSDLPLLIVAVLHVMGLTWERDGLVSEIFGDSY